MLQLDTAGYILLDYKNTGLKAEQKEAGTCVYSPSLGMTYAMPHNRYALSSDSPITNPGVANRNQFEQDIRDLLQKLEMKEKQSLLAPWQHMALQQFAQPAPMTDDLSNDGLPTDPDTLDALMQSLATATSDAQIDQLLQQHGIQPGQHFQDMPRTAWAQAVTRLADAGRQQHIDALKGARMGVILEGGLVQDIVTNHPDLLDIHTQIIDFDTEDVDLDDLHLVPQLDGSTVEARVACYKSVWDNNVLDGTVPGHHPIENDAPETC